MDLGHNLNLREKYEKLEKMATSFFYKWNTSRSQ